MKSGYALLASIAVVSSSLASPLHASTSASKNQITNNQSGIIHAKDATGGGGLINFPGVSVSPQEQQKEKNDLKKLEKQDKNSSQSTITPNVRVTAPYGSGVSSPGSIYDEETNPIQIGNWNLGDCGTNNLATYARHTLGDLSTQSDGSQYLTSYGDASYWSSGDALPYKNGNYDPMYPQGAGVDVGMNIQFSVRDLKTNLSETLTRTQWGPNQCPGSIYAYRIADLNINDFQAIHGNTSSLAYVRTWVPLTTYDPS